MVSYGIDNISKYKDVFKDKRLGLITSISGVTSNLVSSIEVLHEQYTLSALFAPEHGVRGDKAAGELVDTYIDEQTSLPVYSLYRKDSKRLTCDMLDNIDALVYDIQDVGTRYYTFISTLLYVLEDCAKYNKEVIVLDRPNPLGGNILEGITLTDKHKSFVGSYNMPIRYSLTVGELAQMMKDELKLKCELTIISCEGLTRDMLFCDMKNYWLMPSLGIPRFETALLYPGTCLIEGTTLSEGRGTSCPFEIIGAPYINGIALSNELNSRKLKGVIFTPTYFIPSTSKHQGVRCEGVHFHLTDYNSYKAVETGIELLDALRLLYPNDFSLLPTPKQGDRRFISLLFGDNCLEDISWDKNAIFERSNADCADFKKRKKAYEIYK